MLVYWSYWFLISYWFTVIDLIRGWETGFIKVELTALLIKEGWKSTFSNVFVNLCWPVQTDSVSQLLTEDHVEQCCGQKSLKRLSVCLDLSWEKDSLEHKINQYFDAVAEYINWVSPQYEAPLSLTFVLNSHCLCSQAEQECCSGLGKEFPSYSVWNPVDASFT